jgi:thiol-disulfide isomerase/thioredoxin
MMTPKSIYPTCFRISHALLGVAVLASAAFAQSPSTAPGCEPAPEVGKALDQLPEYRRDPLVTDWQVYLQRLVTLKSLSVQYPNDVFVQRKYIESATSLRGVDKVSVEEKSKADAEFKSRYERNPDDPETEYLYALTLVGRDTPQAIKLLDAALQKNSNIALPHLELAYIYLSPAFQDEDKARSHVTAYITACPGSLEGYARLMGIADKDMLLKYAEDLRKVLESRTDEESISGFRTLWSMEFKAHPASEFDSLRKQVSQDAVRLRQLDFENSGAWYDTLDQAYRLANDKQQIEWIEDQRRKHFYSVTELPDREKWFKDHPSPAGNAAPADRQAYFHDLLAQTTQWLKQLPAKATVAHFEVFGDRVRAMSQLSDISAQDLQTAVEQRLKFAGENGGASPWSTEPSPWSSDYEQAAETLWSKHFAPEHVIDYAQKAFAIEEVDSKQPMSDLYATKDSPRSRKFYESYARIRLLEYEIDGYSQLKQFDRTDTLLAQVDQRLQEMKSLTANDDDKTAYSSRLVDYWRLRAQVAELRGQRVDAMSFYQTALLTRLEAGIKPPSDEKDELVENAHRLWISLQGTEDGWQLWYGRRANDLASKVALDWQKTNQPFAWFELTDLNSHTWNQNSLKGKITFINFWATWCGPCREELPHLQELIVHYKDRPDIQFLSMNMDENPGLVQPFVEEHKLSMTVIPAVSFISDTLKVGGIPQNWIVDQEGVVRQKSIGYDSTEKWMTGMEAAIEEVKSATATSPARTSQ